MERDTVLHIAEGLMVLVLFAFIIVSLMGKESVNVIQAARGNLTTSIAITMLNKAVPPKGLGPVSIAHDYIGNTWFYKITVEPKLKIVGERKSDTTVISFIEFKEQSLRAVVKTSGSDKDKFTIRPEDDVVDEILTTEISTEIPPIAIYEIYTGALKQNFRVLIKGDAGPITVRPIDVRRFYVSSIYNLKLPECKAEFELECKDQVKDSRYLKACTPEGTQRDCEETVDLCGGTATIKVRSVDCRNKLADVEEISYNGGKEWEDAGEELFVSFWFDNTCTRSKNIYEELLTCVDKDTDKNFMIARFKLKVGILSR